LSEAADSDLLVFQVQRESGEVGQARIESLEDALTSLRANLRAENAPEIVQGALYRILKEGVRPNLVENEDARDELRAKALASLRDVVVHVQEGETIIEPNTTVTPEQIEKFRAYQADLHQRNRLPTGMDRQTIYRILLVFGVIVVAGFYIRLEDPMTLQSNSRLALLALVLVFSLSMVRATLEWSNLEVFDRHPEYTALLPYVAPMAFAPMVIAVLVGAGPALFSGLLISVFSAVIFGNRLEVLVL
jgi:membrane-associated HD superfamily phosphohydrolase